MRLPPPRATLNAALVAAALVLTACSDDGPSLRPSAAAVEPTGQTDRRAATVEIERSRFLTPELVVPAGTTVTFVNLDEFAHTVTGRDDAPVSFDSGTLGQGDTFSFTFEEPGEYRYFCLIHPTMRAVVVVT